MPRSHLCSLHPSSLKPLVILKMGPIPLVLFYSNHLIIQFSKCVTFFRKPITLLSSMSPILLMPSSSRVLLGISLPLPLHPIPPFTSVPLTVSWYGSHVIYPFFRARASSVSTTCFILISVYITSFCPSSLLIQSIDLFRPTAGNQH